MILRSLTLLLICALLGMLAGCEQQSELVYVLEEPQTVTLTPSASKQEVQQGETVALHVARRTSGNWKQVPLNEISPGQCWVYRPPVESEPEVADSVQWKVVPERAVTFHREIRMDHTRMATMDVKGTVQLTPVSEVKCEPDRLVEGSPIVIEVS